MSDSSLPRVVVVGGTSGVGRALVRSLARAGSDLVIVGRDGVELEATVSDLEFRHGRRFHAVQQDIADPCWDVQAFVNDCRNRLGGDIDSLFVPAGGAREDDVGPNPDAVAPLCAFNFIGPARLGAAFGRAMSAAGHGSIVFVSSIAAAAPRTKNAAYSAAKAALETYATGLRHALEPSGVKVITVSLGYVDTPQTYGMSLGLPIAAPEVIAERLIELSRGAGGRHHLPRFWSLITTTLRALPWPLYRHIK